jgi:hypothetical protein
LKTSAREERDGKKMKRKIMGREKRLLINEPIYK